VDLAASGSGYVRLEGCFERCAALRSVSLPQGVRSITNGAFSDCPSLGADVDARRCTRLTKIVQSFNRCGDAVALSALREAFNHTAAAVTDSFQAA
jgi:hypothetical protein